MGRTAPGALLMGLRIDRSDPQPLYRQLTQRIAELVRSGQMTAGERMPSTRAVAEDLGISRVTVVSVFEQLIAEGYFETRDRQGTYVAAHLPEELLVARRPEEAAANAGRRRQPRFSDRSKIVHLPFLHGYHPFNPALPGVDIFPTRAWAKLVQKHWRREERGDLGYVPVDGVWELREAIAAYVRTARAVECEPGQVVIVSGCHHAIVLACFVLLNPGEVAWCEDPCHDNPPLAILSQGIDVVHVPIDGEGIDIEEGMRRAPNARLAYVKPARNYPMGQTMSIARRLRLLEWAERHDAWIIEDDYDGEYWYSGSPAPSLQSIDDKERVIYIGTFSKTLFPALGINYMILPAPLVRTVASAHHTFSRPPPIDCQRVIAEFLKSGQFSRHVRRMRKIYAERMRQLHDIINDRLGGLISVEPVASGHHFIGKLGPGITENAAYRSAMDFGLLPRPLTDYTASVDLPPALLVGFACVPPDEMAGATDRLGEALRKAREMN